MSRFSCAAAIVLASSIVWASDAFPVPDPIGFNIEQLDSIGAQQIGLAELIVFAAGERHVLRRYRCLAGPELRDDQRLQITSIATDKGTNSTGLYIVAFKDADKSAGGLRAFALERISLDEVETIFRSKNDRKALGTCSPDALACWQRIVWRKQLSAHGESENVARKILDQITAGALLPSDKPYVISILLAKAASLDSRAKQLILERFAQAEKESLPLVRAAWISLLQEWMRSEINKPTDGVADAARTAEILLKYCRWWDSAVMEHTSIQDRALYCSRAAQTFARATSVLDAIKKEKSKANFKSDNSRRNGR